MSQVLRFGLRRGAFLGVLGVLLALPYHFLGYRLMVAEHGATAMPVLAQNLLPLMLLIAFGIRARQRGLPPGIIGVIAGAVFGAVNGLTMYVVAVTFGPKTELVHQLLAVTGSTSRAVVLQQVIFHPNPWTTVGYGIVEMAFFGWMMGAVGGWLLARRSGDTHSQKSSKPETS